MAGNGRHPKVRLDRDGAKACAVSNRAQALGMPVHVWLLDTSGVVIRHRHSTSTNEARFSRYVGEFTRMTPTLQIERALARFVGTDLKHRPAAKPAHGSAPLNLALCDMPGDRGALLGCGEFTRAYLGEAA